MFTKEWSYISQLPHPNFATIRSDDPYSLISCQVSPSIKPVMEDEKELLAEDSTQSDGEHQEQNTYNRRVPVVAKRTPRALVHNGYNNGGLGQKRNVLDLPHSVDDSPNSESINIPRKPFRHYPQRPQSRKWSTRLRWCLGVSIVIGILVLGGVGIFLVYTSSEPAPIWWRSAIIYQCYPQSFQDTNGDGIGDLKGIRDRVDYFSDIGVQAVWLNPIYESPQKDNGYDVSNYTSIYAKYGNMSDLRGLLADLHDRGLKLILDFVPNHTSDEHPWFKESRSSKTDPKRNWYVWADGDGEGGPPNNWISLFGGSAWTHDNTTNQWYLHQFSSFQPDLNYWNEEVVGNMTDVLKFWLDLGVDGFRVDAVEFLLEDPRLGNEADSLTFNDSTCDTNISDPICYNSLIHNLTSDYPGIHNITRHWKSLIDEYATPEETRVFIAEIYDSVSTVMEYYGENGNEFSFPFNFFLLNNQEWSGTSVSCVIAEWINNMPDSLDTPNWVLGNHDNPRIASKAGVHVAKALNVLLLTLPGTVTTYYGEEIMMTDVYVPPDKQQDTFSHRDAERTPMQWNYTANAGFTPSGSTPWLPIATNYSSVNVEVESAAENKTSMLHLYKKLSALRTSEDALKSVDNYFCINATDDLLVYARQSTENESFKKVFVIAINFSPRNISTNLGHLGLSNTEVSLSSFLDKSGKIDLSSDIILRGGEGLVVMGTLSSVGSCQKANELTKNAACNFCNKNTR